VSAELVVATQAAELRRIVAEFLEVDAEGVGPDTDLRDSGLATSLARAGLDAALRRRLGIQCPVVYTARRYAELEASALGKEGPELGASEPQARPAVDIATTAIATAHSGIHCGIDIEEVSAMPEAQDFWEHEFFSQNFSDAEIAYCSMQARPHEHFAVRWAAKEALKKTSPEYLNANNRELEVTLTRAGAPALALGGRRLPVALSLAHTRTLAVAVAVAVTLPAVDGAVQSRAANDRAAEAQPAAAAPAARPPRTAARPERLFVLACALAALGIAIWALARSFI
jgi:holo-[acyl-carrier protein] synthase